MGSGSVIPEGGVQKPILLALTGASGAPYGMRLLQYLLQTGRSLQLLLSPAARQVLELESAIKLPSSPAKIKDFLEQYCAVEPGLLRVFGYRDWKAPIASGSNAPAAMVICPCSMGTLAAIAAGMADNLIERAADVCLKERRPLILVTRETPLSEIHLRNMLTVTQAGAVVLPPSPGFYYRPALISDLVDFVVAKILDQLEIPHDLSPGWGKPDLSDL